MGKTREKFSKEKEKTICCYISSVFGIATLSAFYTKWLSSSSQNTTVKTTTVHTSQQIQGSMKKESKSEKASDILVTKKKIKSHKQSIHSFYKVFSKNYSNKVQVIKQTSIKNNKNKMPKIEDLDVEDKPKINLSALNDSIQKNEEKLVNNFPLQTADKNFANNQNAKISESKSIIYNNISNALGIKNNKSEEVKKEQNITLKNIEVEIFYTKYLTQLNLGNQSVARSIYADETANNTSEKIGAKINVAISQKTSLFAGYHLFKYKQKYSNISIDSINSNTLYGDIEYQSNFGISPQTQENSNNLLQEINYSGLLVGVEYKWFKNRNISISSALSSSVFILQKNSYHIENSSLGNPTFGTAGNLKNATLGFTLINKIQFNINDKLSLSGSPELQYFSPTENRNFKPFLIGIQFGIFWKF